MKLLTLLTTFTKKIKTPVVGDFDYKQEALIKQGREQFKKLLDKGLGVPVVLL